MGEMKHTPGPWSLDGYNLSTVLHRTAEKGSSEAKHLCGDYETVARCEGENWLANARLIAATPDLLESAEDVLVAWSKLAEALPQDDRIEDMEFAELMSLRRAVATARGISIRDISKHLLAKSEGGAA